MATRQLLAALVIAVLVYGCKRADVNLRNASGVFLQVRERESDRPVDLPIGADVTVKCGLERRVRGTKITYEYDTVIDYRLCDHATLVTATIDSAGRIFIDDAQHKHLSPQPFGYPSIPRVTRE